MDKELENYFYLLETGFRKMTRKKRGLDILQFFVELYTHLYCKMSNRFRDKILSDKE